MLLEHEGFLMWYAKESKLDHKYGVDIDLTILDSNGIEIMRRHAADPESWNITATSVIPLLTDTGKAPLKVIGIANDESYSTAIVVRPESDILKVKGFNPEYPDIYGSPDTIRNREFFIKDMTSSAYTFARYLEVFGLNFSDVKVRDVSAGEAIIALNARNGEGAALWSPDTYEAAQDGFRTVAFANQLGVSIPMLLIADDKFARENPDTVASVLAAYIEALDMQNKDINSFATAYRKFLQVYSGKVFANQFCKYDIENHSVFGIDEQLKFFNEDETYESRVKLNLKIVQNSLSKFIFNTQHKGKYFDNVTDEYLKLADIFIKENKDVL